MADLEKRVDKLEGRVTTLEITVEKLSQKIDDAITESRADRAEMKKEIRAQLISVSTQPINVWMKNLTE